MASSRPLIGRTLPPHPAPHGTHKLRHAYVEWEGDACCDKPKTHPIHIGRFSK